MIWGYGQYVPAILATAGASIVTCSVVWETVEPKHGAIAALGMAALALMVEVTKPFAVRSAIDRHKAFWLVVLVCVMASALAEVQLLSRSRVAYANQTSKVEEVSADRVSARRDLVNQLAVIQPARSAAELEPLIEAAGPCVAPVSPKDREGCKRLPALKSEAARAIQIAELRRKIEELDKDRRLPMRGKTEEGEALSMVLGWFGRAPAAQNVDLGLALLMTVLFQLASVGAAAIARPETAGQNGEAQSPEKPVVTPVAPVLPTGANEPPKQLPPPINPRQGLIVTFLRGKGGAFAGSRRAMAEALGWSRRTLQRELDDLIDMGIVEATKDGPVRLIEKEIA